MNSWKMVVSSGDGKPFPKEEIVESQRGPITQVLEQWLLMKARWLLSLEADCYRDPASKGFTALSVPG